VFGNRLSVNFLYDVFWFLSSWCFLMNLSYMMWSWFLMRNDLIGFNFINDVNFTSSSYFFIYWLLTFLMVRFL